jgi:polysaccharide export outer membrane protein
MRLLLFSSLLLLPTMSSVHAEGVQPSQASAVATVATPTYRVAAADILEVTVQDHADLSRTAVVLPDGTISYPYVGEFKASGLTLREIADRVTAALSKEIAGPQVTVTIKSLHERLASQVSVLGAVRTPGKHVLKEGWRVFDLLVEAGGLPIDRPDAFAGNLVRNGTENISVDIARIMSATDAKANILLMPGDVLLVHETAANRSEVQILGEVVHTGTYNIGKDGSIVALISAAGGPTTRAALTKATITHNGQTQTVDLSGFLSEGKIPESVKIAPGDTLFIPQSKLVFYVYGAVAHPGLQTYPDGQGMTTLNAIALAGGQAADANLKAVAVNHPNPRGKATTMTLNLDDLIKKGDLSKDVALQPGDILYVPSHKRNGGPSFATFLSALPIIGFLAR